VEWQEFFGGAGADGLIGIGVFWSRWGGEDGTELYNKDLRHEAEHRFTKEQYLKKSDEMWTYWESQGYKPYVVGSDSSSKKIAYKTEGGALIQFDAGEGGLMVFADSACVLPGEPDPLAS